MFLRASDVKPRLAYDLLTSLVVPRPIAWVSTMDAAGHTNLAPFSYFAGLGSDPPMVTLALIDKRDGSPKDTLRIARDTGVLCIHLVEAHDLERMNASSGEYPAEVSEIDALGIGTVPCDLIRGARVSSARAALECKLVDVHRYGNTQKVSLFVCEVLAFHADDSLLEPNEQHASATAIDPVARLAKGNYALLGERWERARPRLP